MEGKILGNRYELIEKIGGGGMATVYKAKCRLLNRFVAVKILRPEFTNDEEFVKRFRVEAQAAASLSHPNIVSIYDVGYEDNIHYIVMEYVNGITLKDYIEQKGALPWQEAVDITIQVCSAIEVAHANNIVHRDIKPHNILLTKDGIAKVTDFGIARAVSSSTITMAGSTIGSVHYFSPEQARGGYTDEKSDLYSLGITMYEMVTGRLPFDGETPVSIAIKHIQTVPIQPIELNRYIPTAVNAIIMKAIRKGQDQRYQTARSMLNDLYRCIKDPYGNFVVEESYIANPTKRMQAITDNDIDEYEDDIAIRQINNEDEYVAPNSSKKTIWIATAASIVVVALLVILTIYMVNKPAKSSNTEEVIIQNYIGKNFNDVRDELEAKGITVDEPNMKYSDEFKENTIMAQSIKPGQPLKPGGFNSIKFDVSKGPEKKLVPSYIGKDYKIAEAELRDNYKLKVEVIEEFSDFPIDTVIRTVPEANSEVKAGDSIKIYKSKGPEIKMTEVPDLTGKTLDQAKQILSNKNLKVGNLSPSSPGAGLKIIKQEPSAGQQVQEDTAIDLYFEEPAKTSPPKQSTTKNNNENENSKKVQSKTIHIELNSDNTSDTVTVFARVTPSDTKEPVIIYPYKKVNKNDFPLPLTFDIPQDGYTEVYVEIDGEPFIQEVYQYEE